MKKVDLFFVFFCFDLLPVNIIRIIVRRYHFCLIKVSGEKCGFIFCLFCPNLLPVNIIRIIFRRYHFCLIVQSSTFRLEKFADTVENRVMIILRYLS